MSITANTPLDANQKPENPWKFGTDIQYSQPRELLQSNHSILFNKGRYFETSIYDKAVLNEISSLTGLEIQYNNMIVASWKDMEDFVIAMNILGFYVKITIDYI